jgi:hypothetical protein
MSTCTSSFASLFHLIHTFGYYDDELMLITMESSMYVLCSVRSFAIMVAHRWQCDNIIQHIINDLRLVHSIHISPKRFQRFPCLIPLPSCPLQTGFCPFSRSWHGFATYDHAMSRPHVLCILLIACPSHSLQSS